MSDKRAEEFVGSCDEVLFGQENSAITRMKD
jgi:hypothetical protein